MSDVIRSPLLQELGFLHGFSLRTGGTSTGGFASLNLGRAVGDDPERVELNHRRFAQAVGYEPGALFESSQVHGADLRVLSAEDEPAAVRTEEADALLAVHAGAAVGVRVADCVPLLLADVNSGVVAAVHAGWRGTVSGVVEAAFQGLLMAGSGDPSAVVAAIFPHIRRCCFEVGDDVAATLAAASRDHDVVDRTREKPHVDLERVVTAKLLALGVPATRIDRVVGCTRCEPERYFSFRRDGQRSGRHVAAIVARGQIGPRS